MYGEVLRMARYGIIQGKDKPLQNQGSRRCSRTDIRSMEYPSPVGAGGGRSGTPYSVTTLQVSK